MDLHLLSSFQACNRVRETTSLIREICLVPGFRAQPMVLGPAALTAECLKAGTQWRKLDGCMVARAETGRGGSMATAPNLTFDLQAPPI